MAILRKALVPVAAMIALLAGFWVSSLLDSTSTGSLAIQGTVLPVPRKISVPVMTRDDGSVFDQDDITGHWSLLFFGYTNCPDVCPSTLNMLAQAKKAYHDGFPEVIFVSVDPQRDTPELLGSYVRYFDPEFNAVTGSPDNLQALSLQTSVVYMTVPDASASEENYLVEHSSSILLINPQGRLHAFLSAPHTSESILEALKQVMVRS